MHEKVYRHLVSPLTTAAQHPAAEASCKATDSPEMGPCRAHAFKLYHKDGFFPLFTLVRTACIPKQPGFLLSPPLPSRQQDESRVGCSVPSLCDAVMAAGKSGFCRTLRRKKSACISSSLYLAKTKCML